MNFRAVTLLAALTCLSLPTIRAVHAESIFVGDTASGVVHEYTGGGTFVRNLTTGGPAGSFHPRDLTFGADGMLYAVNFAANELEKFNPGTGVYLGAVGNINAVSLNLGLGVTTSEGITLGPGGDLYVMTNSQTVFKIEPAQGTNAAGTTLFLPAHNGDFDLAFVPGTSTLLAMGSSGNKVIYDATGNPFTPTGLANGGPVNARGITFGPDGRLYIADRSDFTVGSGHILVAALPATTGGVTTAANFATSPAPASGTISFNYIDFDGAGNLWATADDAGSGQVFEFNGTTGAFIQSFPHNLPPGEALTSSLGIAVLSSPTLPVPGPETWVLMCSGLLGLLLRRKLSSNA